MPSFCFRLWHEALEPQTTNITTNHGKMNEFQLLPTHVYTKPRQCRPKRAYANAYATYAICMGAYAWGIICLVEFPVYRFKKGKNATQFESSTPVLGLCRTSLTKDE